MAKGWFTEICFGRWNLNREWDCCPANRKPGGHFHNENRHPAAASDELAVIPVGTELTIYTVKGFKEQYEF